jgi:hypothetical protein
MTTSDVLEPDEEAEPISSEEFERDVRIKFERDSGMKPGSLLVNYPGLRFKKRYVVLKGPREASGIEAQGTWALHDRVLVHVMNMPDAGGECCFPYASLRRAT